MRKITPLVALSLGLTFAGCSSNSTPSYNPQLPPAQNNGTVPAAIQPTAGYTVTVFAAPTGSTNPDSLVQIGKHVFVGFGDAVNPDGTPTGSQVEINEYDLSGNFQKTFKIPGHNDGLMAYDSNTLWAMSNEDANATLVAINVSLGTQTVYKPQASLVNGTGGLPHGGGLDDMQIIGGKVYVSASNPTLSTTATCPANSTTPGCTTGPGVNAGPIVYQLTLNGDGATFNLTPVASSGATVTSIANGNSYTLNATDADSEAIAPNGSLVLDSQGDGELIYLAGLTAGAPTLTYLPLTQGGAMAQVDDTRFAPSGKTAMLVSDTNNNMVFRIDGAFGSGNAFSSQQVPAGAVSALNTSTGVLTPIVSGFLHPNGMLFLTPQ